MIPTQNSSFPHFTATLIQHGLFPSAPIMISIAIITRTLQFFYHLHSHALSLSIQSFVHALCDSHGVSTWHRLSHQKYTLIFGRFLISDG
jgi:hypothetical protein